MEKENLQKQLEYKIAYLEKTICDNVNWIKEDCENILKKINTKNSGNCIYTLNSSGEFQNLPKTTDMLIVQYELLKELLKETKNEK